MKAFVNKEECIGCGLCAETCPSVFSMQGDKSVAIDGDIPEEAVLAAIQAKEECPVGAISLK